ncbi:Transmembrane protein 39A [Trichinella papuae]|uniref:Transmembrane protein 39A n=1 Tax=Trichinella papuae TaxID=268474 RepID=A0A0V1MNK7_9BILA|nr:Transmembrane protein 39A [Trichinella papuae]
MPTQSALPCLISIFCSDKFQHPNKIIQTNFAQSIAIMPQKKRKIIIDCGSQNDLILSEMVNKLQLPQTMDTMATQKSGTTVVTELVDYELKPIKSLSLNSEYCCSAIALLRILEIIFGFVIVGCVTSGLGPGPIIRPLSGQHFVLIVASVFITVTFTFLVIFFLNLHKAILNSIPWRVMDICICVLAVLCYFIAGSIEIWYAHVSWNYEEIGCASKSHCGNFHITWAVAASSDVSNHSSKDAEFDQARSSGGRRVVIPNVRKHSNRTVARNVSDEANRLNAKSFVVASDGPENEQENVLLPQHPVFPDISMVQGELFFECTLFLYSVLVLFLQYLNLYKSLWWLPNSYTQHALKFHLIDLYVLSCVGLILGRRVIWCFLKRLTFITPGCNKRAAFWLLLVEWSLKIPATGAVLTSFSFSFIHVLAFYSRLTLTHLIYPCVFYILLFYNEIVQTFSQYDQPLFARLFNCLSDSGHADYKSLVHACSVVPSQIREEVDVFISDVYNRLKQCLFAAFTTAYYAVFIPCGFAPAYLYIDYVWVAEMSFIVFLTSGTLYLTYLFPIQLCDQLHRAAMHLGKWVYTKSYRFPQTNQKIWSETSLWPDGSMVRMNRHFYRGVGLSIAAQPDNDDHRRYHIMFGDPLRVINILCLASGFLILSQFLLLVHSTEWQHVLTLVLLMFANYVLLFKVFKDKIILGRIYYPSMTHTKLKLK